MKIFQKALIQKNILTTDFKKKIKLVKYYNKFNPLNLLIYKNSLSSIWFLQKKKLYINLMVLLDFESLQLSYRLIMHLSDTSSAAQHLKTHSCPSIEFWKVHTDNRTILEQQNNNKTQEINIPNLVVLILDTVLMYSNVFSCCYCYL